MDEYAVYLIEGNWYQIRYNHDFILGISYVESQPEDLGIRTAVSNQAAKQLEEYFKGERQQFDLPIQFNGTEFQKKVWRALCTIPYGETKTYKEIAEIIGNPKACRAVGMANHRNPIMIVVPCHRVIGADGKLIGYAKGIPFKNRLLELEKKHRIEYQK